MNEKVKSCPVFRTALTESEDYILAEAASDLYWVCGLLPVTAKVLPPEKCSGQNMLDNILMYEREILLLLIALEHGGTC